MPWAERVMVYILKRILEILVKYWLCRSVWDVLNSVLCHRDTFMSKHWNVNSLCLKEKPIFTIRLCPGLIFTVKMPGFGDLMPCSLAEVQRRFRSPYHLHHQVISLVTLMIVIARTSGKRLWDCTERHPRGLRTLFLPPWEPEISTVFTRKMDL